MVYASTKLEFMGARMRDCGCGTDSLLIELPDTHIASRYCISLTWIVRTLYSSDSDSHLKIVYVEWKRHPGRDRTTHSGSLQSSEVVSRASQPADITTRQRRVSMCPIKERVEIDEDRGRAKPNKLSLR